MIKTIKTVHTIIWAIMVAAIIYTLYAGITNTFNVWLYVSIGLVLFETITLAINRWSCPLTPIAKKYTKDRKDNFDIYLPEWIARHNKTIFTILFLIGLVLVIINWIRR